MPLPVDLAMGAEDGSDLKRGLGLMSERGAGTRGLGLWRGGVVQAVKRGAGLQEMRARQLKIAQGRLDTLVA